MSTQDAFWPHNSPRRCLSAGNARARRLQDRLGENEVSRTKAANCSDEIASTATQPGVGSSGGSCDYYKVLVEHPTTQGVDAYLAECNDIVEALQLTPAEFNIFKEIWRGAAARQGREKAGHTAVRGAEKCVFFSQRMLVKAKAGAST